MPAPFRIALNMTGSVSAGAFTAGVVDFLIDALDSWYLLKNDPAAHTLRHAVEISVMAGASGGGMTSAITAASLFQSFSPVRNIPETDKPVTNNKLYKSWVESIDIAQLLTSEDLGGTDGDIASLLNSQPIDRIASDAVSPAAPFVRREYVADPLSVTVTLTNLRGLPYSLDETNTLKGRETQAYYFGDYQCFDVTWSAAGPNANWDQLREAAKATGAFPLFLAARPLRRNAAEYNQRRFPITQDDDVCTTKLEVVSPDWPLHDDEVITTVNVDGGVINNSPFELARRNLAVRSGRCPDDRNPRGALKTDGAVITIAPFPTSAPWDKNFDVNPTLFELLGDLLTVLVSQSRFSGEELRLAKDNDVFSRFMIAPSDDAAEKETLPALAGGSLGAFAGFLDRSFRDHDYQLGRRNCQRFLKAHFILPETNPLFAGAIPQDRNDAASLAVRPLADIAALAPGARWFPVIPLVGECAAIPAPVRPRINRGKIHGVASLATGRLRKIFEREIHIHGDILWKGALDAAWLALHGRVAHTIEAKLIKSLAADHLL